MTDVRGLQYLEVQLARLRPGIESVQVVGGACSRLAGEDSDGSGDARVAYAVIDNPPILVGMPEQVANSSYAQTGSVPWWSALLHARSPKLNSVVQP